MGKELVDKVVDGLFPNHVKRSAGNTTPEESEIPLFTQAELAAALLCLKKKKAPGPDGNPLEVLKVAAEKHHHPLLDMYNACLKAGYFAPRWKKARLMLVNKDKGQSDSPSSYRPLCTLDTAGKLLETLLRLRLQAAISAAGGLAKRQHGFRRGRSTINAVREVVEAARSTERGNHFSRPICLMATIDVKMRSTRSDGRISWTYWSTTSMFRSTSWLSWDTIFKIVTCYMRRRKVKFEENSQQASHRVRSSALNCGTSRITGYSTFQC